MFDYPSITEICRYLEAEGSGSPDVVSTEAMVRAVTPSASAPPLLSQPRHFATMATTMRQLPGLAVIQSLVTTAVRELLGEAVAADVPLMAAGEGRIGEEVSLLA